MGKSIMIMAFCLGFTLLIPSLEASFNSDHQQRSSFQNHNPRPSRQYPSYRYSSAAAPHTVPKPVEPIPSEPAQSITLRNGNVISAVDDGDIVVRTIFQVIIRILTNGDTNITVPNGPVITIDSQGNVKVYEPFGEVEIKFTGEVDVTTETHSVQIQPSGDLEVVTSESDTNVTSDGTIHCGNGTVTPDGTLTLTTLEGNNTAVLTPQGLLTVTNSEINGVVTVTPDGETTILNRNTQGEITISKEGVAVIKASARLSRALFSEATTATIFPDGTYFIVSANSLITRDDDGTFTFETQTETAGGTTITVTTPVDVTGKTTCKIELASTNNFIFFDGTDGTFHEGCDGDILRVTPEGSLSVTCGDGDNEGHVIQIGGLGLCNGNDNSSTTPSAVDSTVSYDSGYYGHGDKIHASHPARELGSGGVVAHHVNGGPLSALGGLGGLGALNQLDLLTAIFKLSSPQGPAPGFSHGGGYTRYSPWGGDEPTTPSAGATTASPLPATASPLTTTSSPLTTTAPPDTTVGIDSSFGSGSYGGGRPSKKVNLNNFNKFLDNDQLLLLQSILRNSPAGSTNAKPVVHRVQSGQSGYGYNSPLSSLSSLGRAHSETQLPQQGQQLYMTAPAYYPQPPLPRQQQSYLPYSSNYQQILQSQPLHSNQLQYPNLG